MYLQLVYFTSFIHSRLRKIHPWTLMTIAPSNLVRVKLKELPILLHKTYGNYTSAGQHHPYWRNFYFSEEKVGNKYRIRQLKFIIFIVELGISIPLETNQLYKKLFRNILQLGSTLLDTYVSSVKSFFSLAIMI